MDIQAFNELSFNRKLMYDVLSELFSKKPDEILLRKLNAEGLLDFLGNFSKCADIADKIGSAVKELLSDEAQIKNLCEEFENVFLIPGAHTYIPPLASAFPGADIGSGFSRGLPEELAAIYGAYGARFSNGKEGVFVFHLDHVATLFNFMSFLIEKEEACLNESSALFNDILSSEKWFFERFIKSWINTFLSEMRQRVFSDFYKLIAAFTESHVSNEDRIFGFSIGDKCHEQPGNEFLYASHSGV
jgi:TorA maturation chaperone TorD